MKTDTSRVSKAYRQIFFAVPLTVIALVALLVIASTNSSLLDRYFLVLMVLNLVAASVLVILTAWLCIRLFLQWRRHQFGSQMTLRLTIQITLIAVLPCLLLYAVSSRFIGRSIDSWFNVRVEHALDSGVNLSRTALANLRKQTAERVRILGYALADQPQFEWKIDLPRLRERYGLTNVMIANGKGEILTTAFTGPTLNICRSPGFAALTHRCLKSSPRTLPFLTRQSISSRLRLSRSRTPHWASAGNPRIPMRRNATLRNRGSRS